MIPQEEFCPVPEDVLGRLYRADPNGLVALIESVPSNVRAMLAVYCFRRAHLQSIGLAIASGCERSDLVTFGGNMGAALFERARQAPEPAKPPKVTLSNG